MIDTIIFDLGKVLLAFEWEEYFDSYGFNEDTSAAIQNAFFESELWFLGDSGRIPTKEWLQLIIDVEPSYEKEIKKVFANMGKCIYPMKYTFDWIRVLKNQGYKLFYLSNYPKALYKQTEKTLSFLNDFDGGIFSFQEKCMKPELEIYNRLIHRYAIIPEKSLFYDDKIENVEAAKVVGLHAIQFVPSIAIKDINKYK